MKENSKTEISRKIIGRAGNKTVVCRIIRDDVKSQESEKDLDEMLDEYYKKIYTDPFDPFCPLNRQYMNQPFTITISEYFKEDIRIELYREKPFNPNTFDPYFNVSTNPIRYRKKKSATLNIKNDRIGYLWKYWENDDKWRLDKNDINDIKAILNKPCRLVYRHDKQYTNWQMICYYWNRIHIENDIIDMDKYFNGDYDADNSNNHLYVPSTQQIPSWSYQYQ